VAGVKYLSVCSGIEAATVAWHELGWEPVAFSEIEAFPSAVLKHHYPTVPNWGDMTKFEEWPDADVDLLVGGTPCQSFSVAGLRKGLDDPRGNLMLTYGAIARRYRPRWLVWENVPGVLSSGAGRDFGSFLGLLVELGYGWAYRVLDAQYFGVAQRRRRVFVVGCLGDWRSAAAVLFERHSLQGHPAPSREAREKVATTIAAHTRGGGGLGTDFDCDGGLIHCPEIVPQAMSSKWSKGSSGPAGDEVANLVAHALRGEGFDASEDGTGRGTPLVTVAFNWQNGGGYGKANEGLGISEDHVGPLDRSTTKAVAFTQMPAAIRTANTGANGHGISEGVAHTLDQAQGQAVAFDAYNHAVSDVAHTLRAGTGSGKGDAIPQTYLEFNVAPPLTAASSLQSSEVMQQVSAVLQASMQERRLTPRECSRLQGFPDTYLELRYADAEEAHSAQVLHELWKAVGTIAREGWRPGIVASLLTPEILLAGVHGGWVSWEMASSCADASREVQGAPNYGEGVLRELRIARAFGYSPYRRESFEQLARELGTTVQELPLEEAQAREILRCSRLWPQAQRTWPLRYALATEAQRRSGNLNTNGPRYKALGNSMAVPVMRWIGKRIDQLEKCEKDAPTTKAGAKPPGGGGRGDTLRDHSEKISARTPTISPPNASQ